MTDIYLCRHGRTSMNVAGLLRGRLDPDLDLVGVTEARDLAAQLGSLGLARIVSSPLLRSVETATPIADAAGLDLETDERWLDRDYDRFNGTAEAEVIAQFGSLEAAPGVEPSAAVTARATAALEDLVEGDPEDPIVVVSHDAVIRLLLDSITPGPQHLDHIQPRTGCWSLLRHGPDGWRLVMANRKDDPVETALSLH